MVRVPQLCNLDRSRLTAPFHPLPGLVQAGGWHVRAEGPEDGVRAWVLETSVLCSGEEGEQPCQGEGR